MQITAQTDRAHSQRTTKPDPKGPRLLGELVELLGAIETDQLSLVYQPIFSLRTLQVARVEALLRWQPPGRPPVRPQQIIELADACYLGARLLDWTVNRAIADVLSWEASGITLDLAINATPTAVSQPNAADMILFTANRCGLDPRRITIELTELTAAKAEGHLRFNLESLRAHGVGIAIDDFGTGESGLSRLNELPFTQLKLDRSFVSRSAEDQACEHLSRFTCMLAQSFGATVVAEGIEDSTTLELMRICGADEVQGYLLGRPEGPDQIAASVERHSLSSSSIDHSTSSQDTDPDEALSRQPDPHQTPHTGADSGQSVLRGEWNIAPRPSEAA